MSVHLSAEKNPNQSQSELGHSSLGFYIFIAFHWLQLLFGRWQIKQLWTTALSVGYKETSITSISSNCMWSSNTLASLNISLLSKWHSAVSFQQRKKSSDRDVGLITGHSQAHIRLINSQQHVSSFYDSMHKHMNAVTKKQNHAWNQVTVFSTHYFSACN